MFALVPFSARKMMRPLVTPVTSTVFTKTLQLPLSFSRHNFTTMPSSSKTLVDFFPKSNPNPNPNPNPSKRLKTTTTITADGDDSSHSIAPISSSLPDSGESGLTAEQRMRMNLKKSLALSKRNFKMCSDKVHISKAEGGNGYVKLEELLVEESWLQELTGEFQKPYAKTLCSFVETEICSGKTPIYPPQHLIFNALNSTPFDQVKAVILGQDPYHGPGQAMGLSFSVPEGIKIPSSLGNIFKELKQDLGCSIPSHGNLERWAVQGVLLLNTVLTVRNHQANSHAKKGWEQFTDAVIRTVSEKKKGIVFLLWGNSAQEKSRLIDETKHHILKSAHPSGLSANRGFWLQALFSDKPDLGEEWRITHRLAVVNINAVNQKGFYSGRLYVFM